MLLPAMTIAPAGDLSTYVGSPLIEETVYRTADGKTVLFRRVIAGKAPAGYTPFWFQDRIGIRTPRGTMEVPVEGPLMVDTLADALAMYDTAVQAAGKAAVEEMEAQARRAALSGGKVH